MKYIFILVLLLACSVVFTSDNKQMLVNDHTPAAFISPLFDTSTYVILDSALGNLNFDEFMDKIIILKNKQEQTNEVQDMELNRPLLILAGKEDNSFELVSQNDHVVLCAFCGGVFGDPYQGMEIKDGSFSVSHYGGSNLRWTRNMTFEYSKSDGHFYLNDDSGVSYHVSQPDVTEDIFHNRENFGRLLFSEYDHNNGN